MNPLRQEKKALPAGVRLVVRMFLALIVLGGVSARAQVGNSGLAFLKLGVSGRSVAMGDALSAVVSGAAAAALNPAGLPGDHGARTNELMFMHREWIQDTRTEFLGACAALDAHNALGAFVNTTTVSGIEIRSIPGEAEATFTARDLAAGLSYGRSFDSTFSLGITVKFLYEKILVNETTGCGLDLGVQARLPIEGLSAGAVLSNIGSMSVLAAEPTKLPAAARVGFAYSPVIGENRSSLLVAGDLAYVLPESRLYENAGLEWTWQETISLRTGYQFGSSGRGFTAGLGVHYAFIMLDYAFARVSSDLGNGHIVSLAIAL
jgi:hypothetical protein